VTVRLDKRVPATTVTSPVEGAVYQPGAALNASFACSDPAGGSGLATCAGDAANGAPIDTRTPGSKTFTVTATDAAGNRTVKTVNYSVGDGVAPTSPLDGGTASEPVISGSAGDGDHDGVPDVTDDCPEVSNGGQADIDADRLGDACDPLPPGDAPPIAGVSALVRVVSGEIYVRLPSDGARGLRQAASFVPLKGIAALPIGTDVDARKGTIELQTAGNGYDPASARAQRQQATLSAAMFQIRQARVRKGLAKSAAIPTDLALLTAPEATRACVAARPLKGAVRTLSATVKGYFRTFAGASTTTARNATFNVTDRCDGTLTEVGRGKVSVVVKGRKTATTVTAGHAYLVRAELFAAKKGRRAAETKKRQPTSFGPEQTIQNSTASIWPRLRQPSI
jgi:hypothetical protein